MNGPTWVNGIIGSALRFDGIDDYVDMGDPPQLRLTSSMTLAVWMYAERLQQANTLITRNAGFGDVGWALYIENGYPMLKIGQPGERSKTSTRTSSALVSPGQWYHIAGVYNAGMKTLDIYVNGVLSNGLLNGLVPSSQRNSGQNIVIGKRTRYFKGTLDDIRIYNRALAADELDALAQGQEPPEDEPFSNIYEAEHAVLLIRLPWWLTRHRVPARILPRLVGNLLIHPSVKVRWHLLFRLMDHITYGRG